MVTVEIAQDLVEKFDRYVDYLENVYDIMRESIIEFTKASDGIGRDMTIKDDNGNVYAMWKVDNNNDVFIKIKDKEEYYPWDDTPFQERVRVYGYIHAVCTNILNA